MFVAVALSLALTGPLGQTSPSGSGTYGVELYLGPLIAPGRVLSMGGAYIAVAEGAGAQQFNPSAVANRHRFSDTKWVVWDVGLDLLNAGSLSGSDIQRNGQAARGSETVNIATLAGTVMLGRLGIGLALSSRWYSFCLRKGLCLPTNPTSLLSYNAESVGLTVGYNFLDGTLITAVAADVPAASFELGSSHTSLRGLAFSAGALWAPAERPYRLGLSYWSSVALSTGASTQQQQLVALSVPNGMRVPWQVGVGASWRFGAGALNRRLTFGSGEVTGAAPGPVHGFYVLVDTDLVLLGKSSNSIGLASWALNQVQRVGQHLTVSPRLGAESELLTNRLIGRVGTYWEPSRYANVAGRLHGTTGFDVRLGKLLLDWELTGAFDLAPSYVNASIGIGTWH